VDYRCDCTCEHGRDALRAGQSAGTHDSLDVPATWALLISSLVHDQAPYPLIMALTILCGYLGATENALREARQLKPQDVVARDLLSKTLAKGNITGQVVVKVPEAK